MITRILTSLTGSDDTGGATLSLIKLDLNHTTAHNVGSIRNALSTISISKLGSNFLVVVPLDDVYLIMSIAKKLGLVNVHNQWLYLISSTDDKVNVSDISAYLNEGDNIGFAYNVTKTNLTCKVSFKRLSKVYEFL